MRKYLILLIILLAPISGPARIVEPVQDTPVFSAPRTDARALGIIAGGTRFSTTGTPVLYFQENHPMAYYLTFYPIAQKDGSTAYVSPQIRVEKSESGSYQYRNAGYDPLWRRLWRLAAIAGTIATAIIYWRGRRNGNIRPESFAESCCFALCVVLLRHALLLTLLIGGGNICC